LRQARYARAMSLRKTYCVAVLACIAAAVCCADTAETPAAPLPDGKPNWSPLFQGVEMARVSRSEPAPLHVYAVRVHLDADGVRFLVTPDNGDAPRETDAARTSTFARTHGCQVAINGSPFSPVPNREGETIDIIGLSISRGNVYSGEHPRFGALVLTEDNRARITAPPIDLTDAHNAIGGFGLLLENGHNLGEDDERHPRTAVGLSKNGGVLVLMVIDGRQPGRSIGTTTKETAAWLAWFGAYDGLNLDGGGSSVLVVADEEGRPHIISTPVHAHVPGFERPTGNHLGVFASPLTDKPAKSGRPEQTAP